MDPDPHKDGQDSRRITQLGLENIIASSRRENTPSPLRIPSTRPKKSPTLETGIDPGKAERGYDSVHVIKQSHLGNRSITLSAGQFSERYEKSHSLHIGGKWETIVSIKRPVSGETLFGGIVRKFNGKSATEQVKAIQSIRHPGFVQALDTYKFDDGFLIVFEFMPLSLAAIASVHILNSTQVSTIFRQVIDGLLYLKDQGLGHEGLASHNVLIDYNGKVKICELIKILWKTFPLNTLPRGPGVLSLRLDRQSL
ncbi:kinase-like domain-containing protein [Ilyonectria destructans]|nr:kinase-like domain-containing protein [Ilyonectria destructans]